MLLHPTVSHNSYISFLDIPIMNDTQFSIQDVFTIVHYALMPYYLDESVTVTKESSDGKEHTLTIPTLEFIMNAIAKELAERWAHNGDVIHQMHCALDGFGDYVQSAFDLHSSYSTLSPPRGGSI